MNFEKLVYNIEHDTERNDAPSGVQVAETIRILSESSKILDQTEQQKLLDRLLNEDFDDDTISKAAQDDTHPHEAIESLKPIRKLSASVKVFIFSSNNETRPLHFAKIGHSPALDPTEQKNDQSQKQENLLKADSPALEDAKTQTFFDRTFSLTLQVFRFLSRYFGFPLGMRNGKFVVSKRPLWYFMFSLFTLRTLYMMCIMAIAVSNHWSILDEFQAVWTGIYLIVFSTCWMFAYLLLVRHIDDLVLLWNTFIQLKPKIRGLRLEHLFMFSYPPAMTTTTLCIGTFSTLVPSLISQLRFIVFYCYANGYIKNYPLYGILTVIALVADWITLFMFGGIVNYVFATHITFFEVWNKLASSLVQGTQGETSMDSQQKYFQQVHILVLLLRIFNISNSGAVLQMKFCLLSLSIASISCLILFSFENLVVVIILTYIGLVHTVAYPALYANAYTVSENLIKFKMAPKQRHDWCIGNPLLHRQVKAVSTTGVWVGRIRTFEQESVILYVDYVFTKILDIVLTYR